MAVEIPRINYTGSIRQIRLGDGEKNRDHRW